MCLLAFVFVLMAVFVASAIRIVPEFQRLVVFRLGRSLGARGPGVVMLIPLIDRSVRIDLREQVRAIPQQVAVSMENIPVSINLDVSYKITDPEASATSVGDVGSAAAGLAVTSLRALVVHLRAVDLVVRREELGESVREKLNETAGRWGAKITNVTIHEVILPRDLQDAITAQATGERIEAALSVMPGSSGVAQTLVHAEGKVLIDGKFWDAISKAPIPPAARVHVRRVILEVEQDPAS